MSNPSLKVVHVTPAYTHPSNPSDDVKVAFNSHLPAVTAMSRTKASMDRLGIDVSKVEVDEDVKSFTLDMTAEDYIMAFKECKNYESMKQLRDKVNSEEHMLRRVYAKKDILTDKPLLKEKYPLLIPVYGNEDIFPYLKLSDEEAKIPKAFELGSKRKKDGTSSIVDRAGFATNWRIFSENLLTLINWDNVFVAGGSVLACLIPPPPKATKNFKCLRKYYHEDAYAGSDIDLFIYGLNEEEGKKKLEEIYEAVCNEIPFSALAFRSAYAISIVSQFPYRHIQIVLRLYSSPAEILMGFDVDSCSCGFDGKQVYMTPRCHQALIRQMNTIDVTRRSPTYELRLAKYADRGFEVEVPCLKRESVDPMIFEKPWDDVRGLAKLLLLEKLRTPEARYAYRQRSSNLTHVESHKMQKMMRDPFLKKRLEYSAEKASDYSTVFLPWGPNWTAKRIRKLMMTKDIVLNSSWSELYQNRGYHTHPCFIGSLEDVLKDCCGECPDVPSSVDPETLECFVHGPLSFIVDDPGRQSIGSFHPITDGDWSDGAFLSKDSEKLTAAANCGDIDAIKELLAGSCIVDSPDSLGRTALHIAVLSNQIEAAKLLLDSGANPALCMKDGRNVIHIAAEYGYIEMLSVLLEKLRLTKSTASSTEEVGESIDLDEINKCTQLSALHYAVLFGHVDCAEFLLNNGATCDRMIWSADHTNGISVVVLAAHCQYFNKQVAIDLYELLHRYGASLKLLDNNFNNVMHQLADFNYTHFMEYLLAHDPVAKSLCEEVNGNCQTPAAVALSHGFYTMAKLMVENGLPLRASEEAIAVTNNRRRKDPSSTRWGFQPLDISTQAPPLIMLMNSCQCDSESSYNFMKYLVDHGEDVNEVWNNRTALDILLSRNPFQTVEEVKAESEAGCVNFKICSEQLEKLLKQYQPDSYEWSILNETLKDNQDSMERATKLDKWRIAEAKMRNEWPAKFYELIDGHGGMTHKEIAILAPEKITRANAPKRSFSPFPQDDSVFECVTVKNGKVLRGMERIKALKESKKQKQDMRVKGNRTKNLGEIAIDGLNQFTIYAEASQYGYRYNNTVSYVPAEPYRKLFAAVTSGDQETVRRLCTPNSKGHCTLLLCSGKKQSPLSIAVNRGDLGMIRLIFELVAEQYTPITVRREVTQSGKVSNYALITGDSDEQDVFVDPNADHSLIVNTCDVNVLFTERYFFDMRNVKEYVVAVRDDHKSYMQEEYKDVHGRECCSILTYLIYRNDLDLMREILESVKKLGSLVFEKDLKANKVKEEDRTEKLLLRSVVKSSDGKPYYGQPHYVDIMVPAIINDNVPLIRLLMQYTMLGLSVLRATDMEPKKAVVKRHLNDNSDNDLSECSYSDDGEEKPSAMEEEADAELNEEGNMEEEEESEYADSDEEEMKALRKFKNEGKTSAEEKRKNPLYPLLVCIRYNSQKAMKYFLDAQRVKQDLETLKSNNASYASQIEEAGGIDEVYDRVFSLKYLEEESRLLLEAAAMTNNEEIFKMLMTSLSEQGMDIEKLVHKSKFYPSLLQFCCNSKLFAVAIYLVKNYSFHENEVMSAYCDLAQVLTGIHVGLNESLSHGFGNTFTGHRVIGRGKESSSPLELYSNVMQMIQLIPAEFKMKVLDKMMSQVLVTNRPYLMEQLVKENPVQLEEYDDIVSTVIQSRNDKAMSLLIDCMGLKEKLMKENPRGYTVVERVMTQYISDALAKKDVAKSKRDDDQEQRNQKARVEEEYAESNNERDLVNLYRLMKTDDGSIAEMLKVVLEKSDGLKRELTSLDEVLDRVKRDSDEVSDETRRNKRRCMSSYPRISNDFTVNERMSCVMNMDPPLHKNV